MFTILLRASLLSDFFFIELLNSNLEIIYLQLGESCHYLGFWRIEKTEVIYRVYEL